MTATASYWCRVSNACGQDDSSAATVSVQSAAYDLNGDGLVNEQDVLLLAAYLASSCPWLPCGPTCGDLNQDGKVDILDLSVIARAVQGTD